MNKLCLNSRDDVLIIELTQVAFFQANGNYTTVYYIGGQKQMLGLGLTKLEGFLSKAYPKDVPSSFIRMGRSLIINQTYLYSINTLKQRLTLSDYQGHIYSLCVPKQILKKYKEVISNKHDNENDKI